MQPFELVATQEMIKKKINITRGLDLLPIKEKQKKEIIIKIKNSIINKYVKEMIPQNYSLKMRWPI